MNLMSEANPHRAPQAAAEVRRGAEADREHGLSAADVHAAHAGDTF